MCVWLALQGNAQQHPIRPEPSLLHCVGALMHEGNVQVLGLVSAKCRTVSTCRHCYGIVMLQ